jgi:tRNA (cytidine/uridine-2'-O-)-methyltransferase
MLEASKDFNTMNVVLYEPEIPQNTGSIARTCAALQVALHLVEPLGFQIDEKRIRRAGLDYWPYVALHVHTDWDSAAKQVGSGRLLLFTTKATLGYHEVDYRPNDILVFGPESRGLPAHLLESVQPEQRLKIPILCENVRSLNLSNAVSIALYEAHRQIGFSPH